MEKATVSYRMATAAAVLIAIVVTMVVGAFFVSTTAEDRVISLGVLGIAIAVGAIVGTAFAPFDEDEGKRFSSYGKAIGIFVTGYVASKANGLIGKALDPLTFSHLSQLEMFRLVAALATGLSVAKLTFGFRSYTGGSKAPKP